MLDPVSISNSPMKDIQVHQVESIPKIKEITPDQKDQSKQSMTKEKTEKVIQSMNDFLKASNTQLVFKFHNELKEYYVAIVDESTNQVVKEIPPKKLLDIYAAMKEYLGVLVDKKV
ncbi:flagellar protein FlaG [Neobacillus massiliamazoniensis]|uniref:Flagellar protein FlaG protein n=1 Tax=Neobacillus massiliamazoniensis TaxID=1499688 RepID=A0A0U1NSJ3_9BACI|nr:flagellar protein FlaG [Neobacillus massiliamazoniensis]CRK80925.1 flagellar protein FlaG protein [Neobacillus massiliamazoniensis]